MEKKGVVVEASKDGKRVNFALADARLTADEAVEEAPAICPPEGPEPPIPGMPPIEAPLKEVDVKKREKVELAVEHVPGQEPKIKQVKTTETTYEVKLRQKEEKTVSPDDVFPLKSARDAQIIELIREMKETSASDIARRLFEAPDKGKTALISVYMSRLEEKGFIERTRKMGRKAFYSLATKPRLEEKPIQTMERLGKQLGVEWQVLEKLREMKSAAPSELAPALFPAEEGRNRTAQLYVTLKRMEEKGLVTIVKREGKKTYFALTPEKAPFKIMVPQFEFPRVPQFPTVHVPHIPQMYAATGLSLAIAFLIFYNFTGGMGFFAAPVQPLQLSMEQQQMGSLQNFIYGVSNINSHPVGNVIIEALLPQGSNLTDYGGAQVSERDGMTLLTWMVSQIQPNEKHMFSFSGRVPGQMQLYATGLSEQEAQQTEAPDQPVQALLPADSYGYRNLDIAPIGYLGEFAITLSAGPEGTVFTNETVPVSEIPITKVIQNITTVPVNETPSAENVTENVTPPIIPPVENVTPPTENVMPPVTPPVENVTQPAENVTPPVTPPVENVTQPAENVTQPEQPVENVTPPVEQPTAETPSPAPSQPAENVTPSAPTGGIVTPPEQPQQEPKTTIKIYLDPDTSFNGNEDLVGEQQLFGEWDGTMKVSLPAKKYVSGMNLVFYSDKGAVVLVKSLGLKWAVEVPINSSETFLAQLYENLTNITENITQNLTQNLTLNVTENITDVTVSIIDASGAAVDADVTLTDSRGLPASELSDAQKGQTRKDKHAFKAAAGEKKLDVKPAAKTVKELSFSGVRNDNITLGLDDVPLDTAGPHGFTNSSAFYAIDPTKMNFTSATVTVTASGTELWKCKDWSFAERKCYGDWVPLRAITPGQEYSFTLTPDDPAYAETWQPDTIFKTVEYYINSTSFAVPAAGKLDGMFAVALPESGGITVESAFIEVYGVSLAGTGGTIRTELNGTLLVSETLGNAGEWYGFRYLVNGTNVSTAPAGGLYGITDGTKRVFNLSLTPSTAMNALSAKAVITYAFSRNQATQIQTAQYYVGTRPTQIAVAGTQNFLFPVKLAGTSPSVKSAWFEIGGMSSGAAVLSLTAFLNKSAPPQSRLINLSGSTSESESFIYNLNATSGGADVYAINDNNQQLYNLSLTCVAAPCNGVYAKLYVTYTTTARSQTTVEFYINSSGTGSPAAGRWDSTFPVQLFGGSPSVKSAFVEVDGGWAGTASTVLMKLNNSLILASTAMDFGGTESSGFRLLANGTNMTSDPAAGLYGITDNAKRMFNLSVQCGGSACYALSAKAVVTYEYTVEPNQTTVQFYVNSSAGTVASTGWMNTSFPVELPKGNTTVQSAFFEDGGNLGSTSALTLMATLGKAAIPNDASVWDDSGSAQPYYGFRAMYNATNGTDTTPYEIKNNETWGFQHGLQCSGSACDNLNSKLIMTYASARGLNPPQWDDQAQNDSAPETGSPVYLSVAWTDDYDLNYALLATNETGAWQNKTTYGSPDLMSGYSDWSNFTWQNASTQADTLVGWRVYANDTDNNQNATDIMTFTVITADTTGPFWKSNSSSIPSNYSASNSTKFNITWTDNTAVLAVTLESNFSGTAKNYTMFGFNSSLFSYNNTLPAGTFYWKSWANDTASAKNWNSSDTIQFQIYNASNIVNLYFNNSTAYANQDITVTFGTQTNATANTSKVTASLYRNEVAVTNPNILLLGGGTYTYKANATGNTNYTYNSTGVNYQLTVNRANNILTLLLNGTLQNYTCSYPCTANITGINNNATIWRNNTNVSSENKTAVKLAAGYYEYTFNTSTTQNYTANSTWFYLNISKASTLTRLYLNDTEGNKNYGVNDIANFTVSVNVSGQTVYLNANISGWVVNSTTTPLMNYTVFSTAGKYNITGYYTATQNYSASSQTYYATVTAATISWNQTAVTLSTDQGSSSSFNVTVSTGGSQTNVAVTELSTNATDYNATPYHFISVAPASIGTMSDGQSQQVRLNCSPTAVQEPGYYESTFKASSTENTTGGNITVGCTVNWVSPGAEITFPLNDTNYSRTIEARVTVSGTPEAVTYSLDGGPNTTMTEVDPSYAYYGGDPLHTGVGLGTLPDTANILWMKNTTGTFDEFMSPTVKNGIVYITGKNPDVSGNPLGNTGHRTTFYINATTGKDICNVTLGSTDEAMTVGNNGIAYLTTLDYGYNKSYALNATNCQVLWNFSIGDKGKFGGAPALDEANNIVIFNGNDNGYAYVYAVNAATGASLWNYTTSAYYLYYMPTAVTVYDGRVYFGGYTFGESGANLFILNETTGAALYADQTELRGQWDTSPTIDAENGVFYVGGYDGHLRAYNLTDLTLAWSFDTGVRNTPVLSTPAVHNGTVFAGGEDNKMYAIDARTGTKKWSYPTGDDIYSSPLVADGKVAFGSNDGVIYVVNENSGALIWSYDTTSSVFSSFALYEGIMYVPVDDWMMYAIGEKSAVYAANITLSDGTSTLRVYANNSDGDWATANITFTTNATLPAIDDAAVSEATISQGGTAGINATTEHPAGNGETDTVIAQVKYPDTTEANVTLMPQMDNYETASADQEASTASMAGYTGGSFGCLQGRIDQFDSGIALDNFPKLWFVDQKERTLDQRYTGSRNVSQLCVYAVGGNGGNNMVIGIYSSSSGMPANLLCWSDPIVIPNADGWVCGPANTSSTNCVLSSSTLYHFTSVVPANGGGYLYGGGWGDARGWLGAWGTNPYPTLPATAPVMTNQFNSAEMGCFEADFANSSTTDLYTNSTTYRNISLPASSYDNITAIKVTVLIDSYDPSASVTQNTAKPDLQLGVSDGMGYEQSFKDAGNFSLSSSYKGDALNTTDANFTITVTDGATLLAWKDAKTRHVRMRGVNMDWNSSTSIDDITYTGVWVRVYYQNRTGVYYADFTDTSAAGTYNVTKVYANDTHYNNANSKSFAGVGFVVSTPPDTQPPQWSDNSTSIPTDYSATNSSKFNVTWTDNEAVSSVLIEGNWSGSPTNYTMFTFGNNIYSYNDTLPAGLFYWKSWANDTAAPANWNATDNITFTIGKADTTTKLYLNGTETDTDYSTNDPANFTVTVGAAGQIVYLDTNISGWAVQSSETPLMNYTNLSSNGVYNITGYYLGNSNYSASSATHYAAVSSVPDTKGPFWTDNSTSIPSNYSTSNSTKFNVTWTDNSGVLAATLESNFSGTATNYTMFTFGDGIYSYNDTLPAGLFYWKSWANDTAPAKNWNSTDTVLFRIGKGSMITTLLLNGTDGDKVYALNDLANFTVSVNVSGQTVYLATNISGWVTNSTTTPLMNHTILGTEGVYNITGHYAGTANYSANSSTHYATVTGDTTPPLWASNSTSIPSNYSTTNSTKFNVTWTDSQSQINKVTLESNFSGTAQNYTMFTFGNNIYSYNDTLPGGLFYWKSWANDTAPAANWNSTDPVLFEIGKAKNAVGLTINNGTAYVDQNVTITYGTQITATAASTALTARLYRNESDTGGSVETITLGANTYAYKANVTGDQNYTANFTGVTYYLLVKQVGTATKLYLNGTEGNTVYYEGQLANFTVALDVAGQTVYLATNISGWVTNSTTTPLMNHTVLGTKGMYNITGYHSATQNYTASSQTYYAIVNSPGIEWNQTSVSLSTDQGRPASFNVTVTSNGTNANAAVYEISTNATDYNATPYHFITALPTSLGSLADKQVAQVRLNCSPTLVQAPGYYEATFRTNSTSNTTGTDIKVGCTISWSSPEITVSYPPNATNYTKSVTITATVDGVTPNTVTYSLNGANNITMTKVSGNYTDWGGNKRRTGNALGSMPDSANILWMKNVTGDFDEFMAPTVANGILYITGKDNDGNLGVNHGTRRTFFINATTGQQICNVSLGGTDDSMTLGSNGIAYFSTYDYSYNASYALNMTNCQQLWNFSIGLRGHWGGTPALDEANDIVIFNGNDLPYIYGVNATSGASIWNYTDSSEYFYRMPTTMSIYNGRVYLAGFGYGESGANLIILNETTGTALYGDQTEVMGHWDSSPTIDPENGVFYIGGQDGDIIAHNLTDLTVVWTFDTGTKGAAVLSTPAFHNGTVFAGGQDNSMYALDAKTGTKKWSYPTGDDIYSSPVVADGKVAFGSLDGKVYVVNENDGTLVWSYNTGSEIFGSPALSDGILYITADNWMMYAFGNSSSAYSATITPSEGANTLRVYANNSDGDWAASTLVFTSNTTLPAITGAAASEPVISQGATVRINTTAVHPAGNGETDTVIAQVKHPDTTEANVTLTPYMNDYDQLSSDRETSTVSFTGYTGGLFGCLHDRLDEWTYASYLSSAASFALESEERTWSQTYSGSRNVTSLCVFSYASGTGANNMVLGIYDDSNDKPNNLLCWSKTIAIADTTGWKCADVNTSSTNCVMNASTQYHFVPTIQNTNGAYLTTIARGDERSRYAAWGTNPYPTLPNPSPDLSSTTANKWGCFLATFANSATKDLYTNSTSYDNVTSGPYDNVTAIKVTVLIDSYNPSASVTQNTAKPDLQLGVSDGMGYEQSFKDAGNFSLSSSYKGDALNTTDANFTITVTDGATLLAWKDAKTRHVRMRGVNMDWNSSTSIDEIKVTGMWVTVYYQNRTGVYYADFTDTSAAGTYNVTKVYANDTHYNNANSKSFDGIGFIVSDAIAPQWSSNSTSIPTDYSATNSSKFNVTWTDNVGVDAVLFESNFSGVPTNYSMFAFGNNVYSYNDTLPAGLFYWISYASDASINRNATNRILFTINKAGTTTKLFLNGTETDKGYYTNDPANFTVTVGAAGQTVYLDTNISGWAVQSSETPLFNYTMLSQDGKYNITGYYLGNSNYSASSATHYAAVSGAPDTSGPFWDTNSTSIPSNYSASNSTKFNVTWTDNTGVLAATLESNFSGTATNYTMFTFGNNVYSYNDTLPAGLFYWKSWANDTAPATNWNATSTVAFTIGKAANIVDLTLNNGTAYVDQNVTITYGTQTTATAASTVLTARLYRNESDTGGSVETITLGANTYAYKANVTGNANYSANATGVTYYLIVRQAPTQTRLFLNGTEGDASYPIGLPANFTVTVDASGGTVYLNANISGWVLQSDTTPLMNYTVLNNEGVFNITGYYVATQNYSASSQTYYANTSFLKMSEDLNASSANAGDAVNVNGIVQLNNGTAAVNATVTVDLNGTIVSNNDSVSGNLESSGVSLGVTQTMFDDVESHPGKHITYFTWSTENYGGSTSEDWHKETGKQAALGGHSASTVWFSGKPSGAYDASRAWVLRTQALDMSKATAINLSFAGYVNVEDYSSGSAWDEGYVDFSWDNGTTWSFNYQPVQNYDALCTFTEPTTPFGSEPGWPNWFNGRKGYCGARYTPWQNTVNQTFVVNSSYNVNNFTFRFVQTSDWSTTTDDGFYVDDINLTYMVDNDSATLYTEYNNVSDASVRNLTRITVTVQVSGYDPSGSNASANNKPDLEVALWNGTDYTANAPLHLDSSYVGNSSNSTVANFTATFNLSSVLSLWAANASERDIAIRGVYFDQEGASKDAINWTAVYTDLTYPAVYTDSNGHYNLTFTAPSTGGTYAVNVNMSYRSYNATNTTLLTVTSDTIPPLYLLNGSNTTEPPAFTAVYLYANWSDSGGMGSAKLATNETGAWQNKTTYGSPLAMSGQTWSNFTWQNNSLDGDTLVAWRIYASDAAGNQNVTATGEFKVGSQVSITLIQNSANLGSLGAGQSNSTSGDMATPFELRNDGNVKANITINGTSLFTTASNPTANYRYAANTSTEGTTYNSLCTDTGWTNMPAYNAPRLFLCYLGWLDSADQAEAEVAVTVPSNEPAGAKSGTVTFIASQA